MTNTRQHGEDYEVKVIQSATRAYASYWFTSLHAVRVALGAEGIEVDAAQGVSHLSDGSVVTWVQHVGGNTYS